MLKCPLHSFFMALALPILCAASLVTLPAPAQPLPPLGATPASLTGTLSAVYLDPMPGSGLPEETRYLLWDECGDPTPLLFDGAPPPALDGWVRAGRQVTVTGEWPEGAPGGAPQPVFRVDAAHAAPGGDRAREAPPLVGSQPWVFILVKFADVLGEPTQPGFFDLLLWNENPGLNGYWVEQSYGAIDLQGSIAVGWYTLPYPRSYYSENRPDWLNISRIEADAIAVADPDVYFPDFMGIAVVLNDDYLIAYGSPGCNFSLGCHYPLDGVTRSWARAFLPRGTYDHRMYIISHEMGHAFGLPHSRGNGTSTYSSFWDIMSWPQCSLPPDPNFGCPGPGTIAYHKRMLGWLTEPRVVTVAPGETATVGLEGLSLPRSGPVMVSVPISGSLNYAYTVEARVAAGYDANLPGEAVIIHEVDTYRRPTCPARIVDADGDENSADEGAMWWPGETFTDEVNGISVTVDAATEGGFTVTITNHSPIIPEEERAALEAVYQALGGEGWVDHSWWLESRGTECGWHGVECDRGHVVALRLPENGLAGAIPPQIAGLSALTVLDLSRNFIGGALPPEIGGLLNLKTLYLSGNKILGDVPVSWLNLTQLEDAGGLDLRLNGLWVTDPVLQDFLRGKSLFESWAYVQTLPPTGVQFAGATPTSAIVVWDRLAYTSFGLGFRALVGKDPGGPYLVHAENPDPRGTGILLENLVPATPYYAVVQSLTGPFPLNPNTVESALSEEVAIRTEHGAPGDADGDGVVTIGELQGAINMFLGVTPVKGCADCNDDGAVTIGEMQKVIRAFLGVSASC